MVNYHTHSRYCDGHGELRDYIDYAIAHDFTALGFSSHAPVPFENKFALRDADFPAYCADVRRLQSEFDGRIAIRLGLEIDYIPGVLEDFSRLVTRGGLDYCIGSVHLVANPDGDPSQLWFIDGGKREVYDEGLQRVFGGDIRKGVQAFFRQTCDMLERNRPTIIGHFNKIVMHNAGRYFSEQDAWYRTLVADTLDQIAACGTICEINTRGIYRRRHEDFYPSREIIRQMDAMRIPVVVSSDAHDPCDLDNFCGAYEYLHEIGYRNVLTGGL